MEPIDDFTTKPLSYKQGYARGFFEGREYGVQLGFLLGFGVTLMAILTLRFIGAYGV